MKKKKLSPVGDIGTESYWQNIGRRFLRHRLGCVSLGVLILISLAALLAPVPVSYTHLDVYKRQTFGVDTGYEQELADAFHEANPDITVKVEYIDFTSGPDKLTAALTSGTAPDILFDAPGRIIEFGNAGYLAPLDDMFEGCLLYTSCLIHVNNFDMGKSWKSSISGAFFRFLYSNVY